MDDQVDEMTENLVEIFDDAFELTESIAEEMMEDKVNPIVGMLSGFILFYGMRNVLSKNNNKESIDSVIEILSSILEKRADKIK